MSASATCPTAPLPLRAPERPTLFRVDRAALPFLADHGFHGLTVLPGSFYLAQAVQRLDPPAVGMGFKITQAEFPEPTILPDHAIEMASEFTPQEAQVLRCSFREAAATSPSATFTIERHPEDEIGSVESAIRSRALRTSAAQHLDRRAFYEGLRRNGNEYGACFQRLHELWRSGDGVVARLPMPPSDASAEFMLNPIMVDAAIQSLMAFALDHGQTQVLRSIDEVHFRPPGDAQGHWVSARLRSRAENEPATLVGDIEVRDDSGTCWLELRGVKLSRLAARSAPTSRSAPATNIVVAATFTAEPIAEVFRFWSNRLDLPTELSFAPYGQVFQSLLDADSAFRRNRDGCNVVLLNPADWITARPSPMIPVDQKKIAAQLGAFERRTLPNGMEIAHLNTHETDYVYREIFEDRCYLRHGIRLPEQGTVVDIGANIGLFSLFVRSVAPGANVFAYEPSPVAFQALKANCVAYGPDLRAFNCGVSDHRGHAALTHYGKSSVFSTFHANQADDAQAIRAVALNVARERTGGDPAEINGLVDELLTDRLTAQTIECPITTVSEIIRDHQLTRIDLLKIDAEKCEWEILRGIEETHWPLIEQIVIEVHDRTRVLLDAVRELLERRGFHCAVTEENLLTGSGLFNVYASRTGVTDDADSGATELQRTANEFANALDAFSRTSTTPTFLALVPSEPASTEIATALRRIESELLQRARALPRVYALGSVEISACYPSADFFQSDARQLGHIPYTADGFAVIGTSLFRKLAAQRRPPLKVIALDCDHTLWAGGCGDDGPLGITVTPPHRALQEFMLRQKEAGMILCLCSKNEETSVWSVFERNPGMVLTRGDITAARINWSPKSANLQSLATELNVGLESILFLDDNPTECAEVRAHCPEVRVLSLPAAATQLPHFLNHVWAFDHLTLTAEDRARSQMLAESGQRENFRKSAPTLKSFIAGLELKVAISPVDFGQIERVAQLTQRTNQFNFSTLRRTEGELLRFLDDTSHGCLVVQVSDRFGDYGLVGVLLYEKAGDTLRVDTGLLSCRVLGRGVEHHMLAELGRRALADGQSTVEFLVRPTDRNQPARDFAASLGAAMTTGANGETIHRISAAQLAELRFEPTANDSSEPRSAANRDDSALPRLPRPSISGHSQPAEDFEAVARELDDAHKIATAVEAHRLSAAGFSSLTAASEPADSLTGKLLRIWRRILGNPRLGPDDRFMEAGGTSLAAVQIVAAVRKELQAPLSVAGFFEAPTVRQLAEKLAPTKKAESAAHDALARGARRAQQLKRRAR